MKRLWWWPLDNTKVIWIVEDDVATQRMIAAHLKAVGLEPVIYESAEKAYEALLAKRKPDLFILDMLLPGMSGIDFVRILKQQEIWAVIPIVVVSVMLQSEAATDGDGDAAAYWINKPFEADNLIQTVQTVLASIGHKEG